jgi:hypothetical protein
MNARLETALALGELVERMATIAGIAFLDGLMLGAQEEEDGDIDGVPRAQVAAWYADDVRRAARPLYLSVARGDRLRLTQLLAAEGKDD